MLAALLSLLAPGLLLPTRLTANTASRSRRIAAAERAAAAAPVEASWDAETTIIGGEPPEVPDFASLGVSIERVGANLAATNITAPNALQCATFASLKDGRDAIVQAHTGSGKTIAFLLPLIEQLDASSKEPQALVVSPSRELAFQTARVASMLLEGTGLSCVALSGGANPNRQIERVRKERPQLLVGTPGRVCELAYEWGKMRLQRVLHLVVDEVDEAFQQPYLPHTRRLLDDFGDGRPLQLVFASATADAPAVRRAALQLMDEPVMLRLAPGASSAAEAAARGAEGGAGGSSGDAKGGGLPATLEHGVCVLPARKHLETLHRLSNVAPAPKCLVFVNSPHRAKTVARLMEQSYGTGSIGQNVVSSSQRHGWPPRAPQTASEGLRLPIAYGRREPCVSRPTTRPWPCSQMPPKTPSPLRLTTQAPTCRRSTASRSARSAWRSCDASSTAARASSSALSSGRAGWTSPASRTWSTSSCRRTSATTSTARGGRGARAQRARCCRS